MFYFLGGKNGEGRSKKVKFFFNQFFLACLLNDSGSEEKNVVRKEETREKKFHPFFNTVKKGRIVLRKKGNETYNLDKIFVI